VVCGQMPAGGTVRSVQVVSSQGGRVQFRIWPGILLMGSYGPIVVVFMLPFAAAMVLLAVRIWRTAAPASQRPTVEPASVPV
jgi:hypothetical protein